MKTKRQHIHFHISGLCFLLRLFLYHWQKTIMPRNTFLFGYEINVKIKINSPFIYSFPLYCVGRMAELIGGRGVQRSSTWAPESSGLGLFLTVPYHFAAVDKPWFSHLPNGDNSISTCSFVTVQ